MPELKPFRALRFDRKRVDLNKVVAPPYDVISPELQNALYESDPYNIVRLDFGREEDRYTAAAQSLTEWRKDGVLIQDEHPGIYILSQTFRNADGAEKERTGFIALCRLEEFGAGSVLRHEKTLSKPKEDRLQLLRTTRANFSQIFVLYNDPKRQIQHAYTSVLKEEPAADVTFDGVRNRLWIVRDESTISSVGEFMRSQKVLVADGHHRYETAWEFRNSMMKNNADHTGNEPYNFVMMYFTNLTDKGLKVLPTHRVLHDLPSFDQKQFLRQLSLHFRLSKHSNLDEIISVLKRKERFAFGLLLPDEPRYQIFSVMSLSHLAGLVPPKVPQVVRRLDVTILHAVVIEKILDIPFQSVKQRQHLDYVKDEHEAEGAVMEGKAQAAFLMNAPSLEQIRAVAEAGKTMPQKSTFFYPKLLSGLVVHSLDGD
jgi:uncharacterized protein (DUF1015 family)